MDKKNFLQRLMERFAQPTYSRNATQEPQYNVPPAIPVSQRELFIQEAQKAGVSPDEFGTIARREQGALTPAHQVALVGGADPSDRGVMQVNKVNEPIVRERFRAEYGRDYNPNKAADSIVAARMVLQENRRIFEQMLKNKTINTMPSSRDIVNSYNLGPQGVIRAKQGDKIKQERLRRYESAGLTE